jgi:osomolarity two-component system, response regulator SKN7
MPKLDGVAATSMIRQFDPSTPIISMTSSSRPDDIMNYINHGMNDILPKPFSKEGLLEMLEVRFINGILSQMLTDLSHRNILCTSR